MSNKQKWYIPSDEFDPKITLKKFLYGLANALILSILVFSINFLQVTEFPPEYAIYIGALIAILQAIENMVKHWHK